MPEYLAPGVFVEETSFRAKSIEGVGTSVAAIVGPTRFGPLRGAPEVVTSFADFQRTYGGLDDLGLAGNTQLNHTAIAAKAFFDNGGKQLYVARVTAGVNGTDEDGLGSTAMPATSDTGATGTTDLIFSARFPGSGGNFTLELSWADPENLLKTENLLDLAEGQTALMTVSGSLDSADFAGTVTHAGTFPLLTLRALVTRSGDTLNFVADTEARVTNTGSTSAVSVSVDEFGSGIPLANLATNAVEFTRIYAANPGSGPLSGGATPAELRLTASTDINAYVTGDHHWGDSTVIRGTLSDDGQVFTASADLNDGVSAAYPLQLSALAAFPGAARSLQVQRSFNLDVLSAGEPVYSVAGISLDPDSERSPDMLLPLDPDKRLDQLTQPVAAIVDAGVTTAALLHAALYDLFDPDELNPEDSFREPRYLIDLDDGEDGDLPGAADYAGEIDEVKGSTGLAALEDIEDIAIVMTPAAAADAGNHQGVVAELQKHCNKMRYRVGIVDSREGMSLSEIRSFRDNFDDTRLALYYPWVVISSPTGDQDTVAVPPAGFMAGIYARTDVDRGVHKSPANVAVFGALHFNQSVNRFQQELLNPSGINCLRSFPGRGHRVWGGRTLSSDPEWKYLNVRRYFLYLERSIEKGTQWAVFEPNGEALWANVRSTVEDFLFNEWSNGRLLGGAPKAAYFVRCDRSTMTQNDIDNGRLVCLVGVAPLRPAEFVVFRIGQKTADA